MNEATSGDYLQVPNTADELADRLRQLKEKRDSSDTNPRPRKRLTQEERLLILRKTDNRCHLCGGLIYPERYWEADHVLSHCAGGADTPDNYLAAHGVCNTLRWHNTAEEFQWILEIGVWARRQMQVIGPRRSSMGSKMLQEFYRYEKSKAAHRKTKAKTASAQ